ncbi:MAG: hypothetical protein JWR10_965 [Rubritepida sp.]|nr:hypothetical protein [Rubritepida sp.]
MDWQPIETAHKDGTPVWLGRPGRMRIGFWASGTGHENHGTIGGGWIDAAAAEGSGVRGLRFAPTVWMALPFPPEGGENLKHLVQVLWDAGRDARHPLRWAFDPDFLTALKLQRDALIFFNPQLDTVLGLPFDVNLPPKGVPFELICERPAPST